MTDQAPPNKPSQEILEAMVQETQFSNLVDSVDALIAEQRRLRERMESDDQAWVAHEMFERLTGITFDDTPDPVRFLLLAFIDYELRAQGRAEHVDPGKIRAAGIVAFDRIRNFTLGVITAYRLGQTA